MEANFTNEDLEHMLNECISELESLGYTILPISSIQFTNRNSRNRFGVCKVDTKICDFNQITGEWEGTPTVYIRITGNLRYLPLEMRSNLKTLVMHETIHAIKAKKPADNKKMLIFAFNTPHGDRYDHIRDTVERNLGYKHIDDDTYCGLEEFLTKQYAITAEKMKK